MELRETHTFSLAMLAFAAVLALAFSSDAQRAPLLAPNRGGAQDAAPVIHTYINPPPDGGRTAPRGRSSSRGGNGGNALPAPRPESSKPKKGEPTYDDDFTGRQDKVRPDTDTKHEGDMVYHAAFNPTVAPMKRTSSMDAVGKDLTLTVRDRQKRRVPLMNKNAVSGRDFFWGSFLVNVTTDRALPIPSVSPDMVPHSYKTTPRGYLVDFYKDGADNHYIKLRRKRSMSRQARSQKRVRIQALVSGGKSYFGGALPGGMRLRDLTSRLVKPPASVIQTAETVMRHIGVRPSDSLNENLHTLVAYFRAFKEGPLTVQTGLPYVDLSLSQRGVCRHRSYAFVITARSMGIPARYVSNELHVFVEVLLPRYGWRRIDLGGATPQMEILHGKNHKKHRPGPDPFPKSSSSGRNEPPNPLDSRGGNRGSSQIQQSGRPGSPQNPLDLKRQGANPGSWVDAKALGLRNEPGAPRAPKGRDADPSGPGPASPAGPDPRDPSQLPGPFSNTPNAPNTTVKRVALGPLQLDTSGLRGTPFRARGAVTHEGQEVKKHRVVVVLYPPQAKSAVVVGETLTDAQGRYDVQALVPKDIPVGLYEVHAHTPAQKGYEEATTK